MQSLKKNNILALDVGEARIGVALADTVARLARPLKTLAVTPVVLDEIKQLLVDEQAEELVIGLPRGLDGQETAQTVKVREFADNLKNSINIPVYFQDEALTSRQAEQELQSKGQKITKEAVDALAATYILEDFINSNRVRKET